MPKVTEGVYFIQGRDEFIPDAHTYVIGDPISRDLSIIDAGLMGKGGYKLDSIEKMGLRLDDVNRIIMTHTHLDHIGCLAEIRQRIPWAELWVHDEEAEYLEKGDERMVYGMDMFRDMLQSQYDLSPGAFAFEVDRRLEGNEELDIGGMHWEILHIPGHSPGSIGLYDRRNKVLIPGDVIYADYAIGRFDLHKADGATLRDSLMRLAKLDVEFLLPGHNRVETNLPGGYILKTAQQWGPYLS